MDNLIFHLVEAHQLGLVYEKARPTIPALDQVSQFTHCKLKGDFLEDYNLDKRPKLMHDYFTRQNQYIEDRRDA
jgi:hypothetical protein